MEEYQGRRASMSSIHFDAWIKTLFGKQKFAIIFNWLRQILSRFEARLSSASRGYVMVLVAVFIPVILLGTKLVLDSRQEATPAGGRVVKRCAKECALKVAQNWNPGLSYKQQKESMLRLADEIYNASPAYNTADYKYNAIPGLEMPTKAVVTKQGMYKPVKVETSQTISLAPSSSVVEYETVTDNWEVCIGYSKSSTSHRTMRLHNPFYAFLKFERDPSYVTEDTIRSMIASASVNVYDREVMRNSQAARLKSQFSWSGRVESTHETSSIKKRKNAGDTKVQIWVENDKIKVKTDDDIGYAVPAECNVDIVLGIPVNGAASNVSNLDANTTTAGTPLLETTSIPTTNGKATPIYQIARGFAKFIKDNFYHTRGTNVGIVPYCGQCSLNPDRMDAWTTHMPHFVATNFLSNQNTYQAYLRPCNLYGMMRYDRTLPLSTSDQNVYDADYGLTAYNLTNICTRLGKYATDANAGNNIVSSGDILSVASPADGSGSTTKFGRMKADFLSGFGGKFNLLAMKYEEASKKFWTTVNPYFIIELQSDLLKITDLLNMFYPFPWYNNINMNSNFIFIPFTWANNLFQSWSNDPKFDAKDTTADSTNLGRLKAPSKTTSGRKKAVIVVVNKPDWFEPGELTYLGYDNDFSELPMIESDCIRGDIDYSSGSGNKFADGTSYDGTVQGAKKILKLTGFSRNSTTGYYECGDGDATLTFPKKYLVKLVVEPSASSMKWEQKSCNLNSFGGNWYNMGRVGVGVVNGKSNMLLAQRRDGYKAYSSDGVTWTSLGFSDSDGWFNGCIYGNGVWCMVSRSDRDTGIWTFTDVNSSGFVNLNKSTLRDLRNENTTAFGNGIFMTKSGASNNVYISSDGLNWERKGTLGVSFARVIGYGNGKWIAGQGNMYQSTDNGQTWTFIDSTLGNIYGGASDDNCEWYGAVYVYGNFYAVNASNGRVACSTDGSNWKEVVNLGHGGHRNINLYNGKLYIVSEGGGCCHIGTFSFGTITFSDISSTTNQCTVPNTEYTISSQKTFYIEPDQINGGSDGAYTIKFHATNIKLVSAEITNRPYVSVTPTVTQSGNVFTLNAKVPFVVTTNQDGTISYTAANGTATTQYVSNSWGYVQVTPESHQYVKTYDSNNNPVYKVTLTHSKGSSAILTSTIGIAEEHTETKSGLTIDHESAGTKSKVSMGSCLSYQKTDVADSTNHKATIDKTNKRILCPLGTILHVKAKPTGTATNSIQFYNTNGVEDNVGTHTLSAPQTFTFRGGQDPSGSWDEVSSSRGPNFGHNLSKYKVRYNLTNAKIIACSLSKQYLREYGGQYDRSYGNQHTAYKQLILNDGTLAKKVGYAYSIYPFLNKEYTSKTLLSSVSGARDALIKFCDTCVVLGSPDWSFVLQYWWGFEFHYTRASQNGLGTDLYWDIYGLSDSFDCFSLGNAGDRKYNDHSMSGASNHWHSISFASIGNPKRLYVSTSGLLMQVFVKNQTTKHLINPSSIDTAGGYNAYIAQNQGIALQRLSSKLSDKIVAGDYICFQGDGELSVTVFPIMAPLGTIKFKCNNESNMTHEVYKEFNFCIEPSQMTNNGDGRQYVEYEMSNCNIDDSYYEYQNYSTIALTKTSDVPMVRWSITGHKKEMVWKAANPHPASLSAWYAAANKHIEYDGTTCYISGKEKVIKSTDLGKSWQVAASIPSSIQNADALNFALARGYWYLVDINGNINMSTDNGSSWTYISGLKDLGLGSHFRAAFTYAKGLYRAMECHGNIAMSSDGVNWSKVYTVGNLNNGKAFWDFGIEFANGSWFATTADYNSAIMLAKIADDGSYSKQMSDSISSSLSALNKKYPVFAAGGSNQMIIGGTNCRVYTSTDFFASTCYDHGDMLSSIAGTWRGVECANGVFVASNNGGKIAYTTYHDGVVGIDNHYRYSQEVSSSTTFPYVEGNLTAFISNLIVTSISGTYVKIVKTFPRAIEFKKLRLPENTRVVNFSEKSFTHNTSLIDTILTRLEYDTTRGSWISSRTDYPWTEFYNKNIIGDFYFLLDDIGSIAPKLRFFNRSRGPETYKGVKNELYLIPGLHRRYQTYDDTRRVEMASFDMPNSHLGGQVAYQFAGFTLPINAMLYAGYYDGAYHKGAWYKDQEENPSYDATEAVKNVTKAACAKLKSDWGSNIRIYLIKYRKQTQYNHKITGTATDFDYSYLNDCASDTGSTTKIATTQEDAGKFRFDISSEADLNTALSAIAANIKDWAGYKRAENK